jgi:hypothetical protein
MNYLEGANKPCPQIAAWCAAWAREKPAVISEQERAALALKWDVAKLANDQ